MKSRGLTLVAWVIAVSAVCFSFAVVRLVDMSNVLGKTHSVQVFSSSEGVSSVEVLTAVSRLAEQSGATIAKEVADLEDPDLRHLYMALGGASAPEASWLTHGYPWFSPDAPTRVHAFDELRDIDPSGTYVVFGGERAAENVAALFRGVGFEEVLVGEAPGSWGLVAYFAQDPIGVSYVAVSLLVGFLVATSVVSGVKSYGVQRLHGAGRFTILGRDARGAVLPWLTSMVVIGLASAVLLANYNDLHQWRRFVAFSGAIYLSLVVVAVIAYLAGLALVAQASVLESIKGRVPWRGALTAVYLVRAPVLLIMVASLGGVLSSGAAVRDYLPTRDAWADAAGGATIAFGGSASVSEMDRYFLEAGEWIRDRELAGDVILALPTRLSGDTRSGAIVVNDAYLSRHTVLDAQGARVGHAPVDSVLVLLPADRESESESVRREVDRLLQGLADHRPTAEQARSPNLDVVVQFAQPDQQVFTYVADPQNAPYPTFLSSPVVVVVNARTEIIAADDYASYASQGRLIFESTEAAQETAPPRLAQDFIDGYRLVAQSAADEHSKLVEAMRVSIVNAVMSFVVLVVTALTLGQLYTRSRGSRLLVQYLHGWPFGQMHRTVLRTELVFGFAVLAWAIVTFADWRDGRSEPGAKASALADPLVWGPMIATCLILASALLVVSTIALLTRRLVRTGTDKEL